MLFLRSPSAPPATSSSSTQNERAILDNPMSRLFFGQVLVEGKTNGVQFMRAEPFGQLTLQVKNFNDIHESLEDANEHKAAKQIFGTTLFEINCLKY